MGQLRPVESRRVMRKVFVVVTLLCILGLCTEALAQWGQQRAKEPIPPRPAQQANPWPWFVAFFLLAAAWFPAFKSSKRELEL